MPPHPDIRWTLLCFVLVSEICSCLHHYYFIEEEKTWLEAKKHCEQNDAVLATVNNQQNVTQLLETVGDGFEGNVWIGLNVTFTEWRWSLNNGSATFTHWGTGEPNNYNGPELCVSTYHGLWNDYPCSIKNFFLCYDNSNKIGGTNISPDRYLYVSESLSWHEAQAYCRKHHTDLASIQSEEEYEVVKNKVPSGHVLAIGLHRELSDNWSDGVQRKFRNWLPGHPSLKSGSCVTTLINRENPGKWIENSCNKKFPFICRKDETQVRLRLKLHLKSTADLNDPAVKDGLLRLMEEKLNLNLNTTGIKIAWMKKHGHEISHKEEKTDENHGGSEGTCNKQPNKWKGG
ncbi:macrophage mannose receptor 1-like isoform X2 [Salarias fasciatus]|uniref:macrophage mannose receptor 1-like isoform X2 n=1 Tax=Salarias fasciatus TaxID=181472 RepID=UPI001176A711|nr:macrophage mannose receptor 1-like isoform X2 [Salarias fasciatus]